MSIPKYLTTRVNCDKIGAEVTKMLAGTMTKYYSVKEAAEVLGVSYRKVYRWIQNELIYALPKDPFIDQGSEFLIPESEIERIQKLREGKARGK